MWRVPESASNLPQLGLHSPFQSELTWFAVPQQSFPAALILQVSSTSTFRDTAIVDAS